jgi:hypothetical protein
MRGLKFLVAEALGDRQIDPVIFSGWRDILFRAATTYG